MLYVFQTVSLPIIGSSNTLHTASGYMSSLLAAAASVGELEQLAHASGDGQRNPPKHVEH